MKFPRSFFIGAASLALTISCPGHLSAAQAQDSAAQIATARLPTNAHQETLGNLGAAFKRIDWDSKAHGLLLAIAPDKVSDHNDSNSATLTDDANTTSDDDAAKPLFAPTGRYGLNAGLVARHFKRKLIHLPTVTVFAPPTMVTLSHDLKPVNPFGGMDTEENMRRLEASLTPTQWKALGSENGLGMGDLSREQEPLFEALIPETSDLKKAKVIEDDGEFHDDPGDNPPIPISAEQRQGLRIRLDRTAMWNLVSVKGEPNFANVFHAEPLGKEKLTLVEKPNNFAKTSSAFGQQIRFQTANTLKPSDLDLKSPGLDVWVPVANAVTVGDLIAATRKATGWDIYADGRLAKLKVTFKGEATPMGRAADLLEALCWALTATYRRVGPNSADPATAAYVLTHDREGLAVRRALLSEWGRRGSAARWAAKPGFDKAIASQNPAQYLSFPKGNLLNPTPEAEKNYDDFTPKPHQLLPTLSVSAMTSAQRTQFREGIDKIAREREKNPKSQGDDVSTDHVIVLLNLTMTLIIPGLGEVQMDDSWLDNTAPSKNPIAPQKAEEENPKTKRLHGAKVILAVAAPHDRAEAETLVQAAVAAGVQQLWIHLADSETTGLVACIAAGQLHHLPVGAIVGLMRTPAGSLPPAADNLNLYGETGPQWATHVGRIVEGMEDNFFLPVAKIKPVDVVDPTSTDTEKQIQERVAKIAATPGLSGLALCDAAVPGYLRSTTAGNSLTGSSFGYTPANRLTFLRQHGYDPIDLDTTNYDDAGVRDKTSLPFFDTDGGDLHDDQEPTDEEEILGKWLDFLAEQEDAALKTLRRALLGEKPALPVYLTASSDAERLEWGVYRLWEKPESLPLDSPENSDLLDSTALSRETYSALAFSHSGFDSLVKRMPETKYTELGVLSQWLGDTLEPDSKASKVRRPQTAGTVLDLSAYSTGDVLAAIKGLFLPLESGSAPGDGVLQ